jgi:hypothetical protein
MYQVLARAILKNSEPQKIFSEFSLTKAPKWFEPLLIWLRMCIANLQREVPRAGLFTLHPLPLIAKKIAIFTQLKLIMEPSLGFHLGIKLKFSPKF